MSVRGSSSSQAGPTALFGRVDSPTLASPQQRRNPLSPPPSLSSPFSSSPNSVETPPRNHDLCTSRTAAGSPPIPTRFVSADFPAQIPAEKGPMLFNPDTEKIGPRFEFYSSFGFWQVLVTWIGAAGITLRVNPRAELGRSDLRRGWFGPVSVD